MDHGEDREGRWALRRGVLVGVMEVPPVHLVRGEGGGNGLVEITAELEVMPAQGKVVLHGG